MNYHVYVINVFKLDRCRSTLVLFSRNQQIVDNYAYFIYNACIELNKSFCSLCLCEISFSIYYSGRYDLNEILNFNQTISHRLLINLDI